MVTEKYQIETSDHRCERCERQIPAGTDYYSAVVFADERFARRNFCVSCWSSRVSGETGRAVERDGGAPDGEPAPSIAPAGFYAFWRARRPEETSDAPRRLRFDTELVLDFFRRLSEETAEETETTGAGRSAAVDESPAEEDSEVDGASLSSSESRERGGGGEDGAPAPSEEGASLEPANPGARASSTALLPRQKVQLRFVLALLLLRKKALVFEQSAAEEGREWLRLSEKAEPERTYWVENPDLSDEELERVRDDIGELLEMNV